MKIKFLFCPLHIHRFGSALHVFCSDVAIEILLASQLCRHPRCHFLRLLDEASNSRQEGAIPQEDSRRVTVNAIRLAQSRVLVAVDLSEIRCKWQHSLLRNSGKYRRVFLAGRATQSVKLDDPDAFAHRGVIIAAVQVEYLS